MGFWKWLRSIEREILLVLLGLAVVIGLPWLLRLLDPSAGAVDLGILHVLVVGVVRATVVLVALFVFLRVAFPLLDRYIDSRKVAEDWEQLTPVQRVATFFGVVAVILWMLVQCVVSL